jgi:hypothetical protein
MLDIVLETVEGVARTWRQDAARRREEWLHDPVAGARERDAQELEAVVQQLRDDTRMLTPEQYAPLVHKSVQTIRRWCRTGQLPCTRDEAGDYLINPSAKRRLRAS